MTAYTPSTLHVHALHARTISAATNQAAKPRYDRETQCRGGGPRAVVPSPSFGGEFVKYTVIFPYAKQGGETIFLPPSIYLTLLLDFHFPHPMDGGSPRGSREPLRYGHALSPFGPSFLPTVTFPTFLSLLTPLGLKGSYTKDTSYLEDS